MNKIKDKILKLFNLIVEKFKSKEFLKQFIKCAVLVLAIIIGIIIITTLIKNKTNEKDLNSTLEKYGRGWYEDYYYVSTGENDDAKKAYLSNFNNVGIKISLDNLLRYERTLSDYKEINWTNSKTHEACNQETTMVTIYPKETYGKSDYQISIYLDCGFTENSK